MDVTEQQKAAYEALQYIEASPARISCDLSVGAATADAVWRVRVSNNPQERAALESLPDYQTKLLPHVMWLEPKHDPDYVLD